MEGKEDAALNDSTAEGTEEQVQEQGTVAWQKMPKGGGTKCQYEVSRSKNAGKRCGRGGLYPLDGQKFCLIHFRIMKSRQERANKPPQPRSSRKRKASEEAQDHVEKRIRTAPRTQQEATATGSADDHEDDASQVESVVASQGDDDRGRQEVTHLPLDSVQKPIPKTVGRSRSGGGHPGVRKPPAYDQEEDDEDEPSSEGSEEDEDTIEAYTEYKPRKQARARKPTKSIGERYDYKGSSSALWKTMKRATELATMGGARRPGSGIFNIMG